MTPEENKAIYARYIEEVFNRGNFEALDGMLSEGYEIRDAPPGTPGGAAGIMEVVRMFRGGFPDLAITLDEVVAEGDAVVARSTLRGTHRGDFLGVPPTGKQVSMVSLTMVHIVDGRLTESWVKNDTMSLMRQLGVRSPGP